MLLLVYCQRSSLPASLYHPPVALHVHQHASEPGDSPVTCQPAPLMLQVSIPDAGAKLSLVASAVGVRGLTVASLFGL